MPGLLITLEGIDGCGKSTQLEMLSKTLEERGLDFIVTRQPGGTPIGERVRDILLANASIGLAPMAELMLYAADRAQHITELVRPAMESGRIVISDRYTDSTTAFQGYGRGLDLEVIDKLNRLATGGLTPDLTIIFDISTETARARLNARQASESEHGMTRFEDEAREFHNRVREGYLMLARAHPERIRIVDASASARETHEAVMKLVAPMIESVNSGGEEIYSEK